MQGAIYVTNPSDDDGAVVMAVSLTAVEGDGELALFQFTAIEDISQLNLSLENVILTDISSNNIPMAVEVNRTGLIRPEATDFEGMDESGTDVGVGDEDIDIEEIYAMIRADKADHEAEQKINEQPPEETTERTVIPEEGSADPVEPSMETAATTEGLAGSIASTEELDEDQMDATKTKNVYDAAPGLSESKPESGEETGTDDGISPVLWGLLALAVTAAALWIWFVVLRRKKRN